MGDTAGANFAGVTRTPFGRVGPSPDLAGGLGVKLAVPRLARAGEEIPVCASWALPLRDVDLIAPDESAACVGVLVDLDKREPFAFPLVPSMFRRGGAPAAKNPVFTKPGEKVGGVTGGYWNVDLSLSCPRVGRPGRFMLWALLAGRASESVSFEVTP